MKVCALLLLLVGSLFAQTPTPTPTPLPDETTTITGQNLQLQSFCGGTQIIITGQDIMAWTLNQTGGPFNPGTSPASNSFGSSVPAGDLVIVVITLPVGATTTVKDNLGNTLNLAVSKADPASSYIANIFWEIAPSTVTGITVTWSSGFIGGWWQQDYTPPTGTVSVDKTNSGNGNNTSPNSGATGTLSSASELILNYIGTDFGITAFESGWTSLNDAANSGSGYQTLVVSATTSQTGTATCNTGNWASVIATFQATTATVKNATWKANPAVTLTENATRVAETTWNSNPKASLTENATRVALTTWKANPGTILTIGATRLALTTMTIQPKATLTMSELVTAPKTIVFSPKTTLAMQPMTIHNAVITLTPQLRLTLNAQGGGVVTQGDIPYAFWGGGSH